MMDGIQKQLLLVRAQEVRDFAYSYAWSKLPPFLSEVLLCKRMLVCIRPSVLLKLAHHDLQELCFAQA